MQVTAPDDKRDVGKKQTLSTATEQALDDGFTPTRDSSEKQFARAIEHGVDAVPAVLAPGQAVIAAAGVCGPLASVLVVFRDEDGHLCSGTHLLQRVDGRTSTAAWMVLGVQVSTCLPEDVLTPRPDKPLAMWHGDELTSYLSDPVSTGQGHWFAAITLRATTRIQVVQVEADVGSPVGLQRYRVAVAPSGLVSAPLPMRHGLDAAVCTGLDEQGQIVDVRHYQVLSELERDWPSPSLWQEPPRTA